MEAVSSEAQVRVRVKVIDEQLTVLYSQDIDMKGRVGTFLVPAIITNTEEITVQVRTTRTLTILVIIRRHLRYSRAPSPFVSFSALLTYQFASFGSHVLRV